MQGSQSLLYCIMYTTLVKNLKRIKQYIKKKRIYQFLKSSNTLIKSKDNQLQKFEKKMYVYMCFMCVCFMCVVVCVIVFVCVRIKWYTPRKFITLCCMPNLNGRRDKKGDGAAFSCPSFPFNTPQN